MTARDTLAIKLILMEALSNVLHHSKAKTVTVRAGYDAPASRVSIVIEDDGVGFNAADEANAGRGISNMRKRTRAISTGGALFIQSAPGRGTTVRVELTVPPESGAAA
jgi:signal transduction histidine kinase